MVMGGNLAITEDLTIRKGGRTRSSSRTQNTVKTSGSLGRKELTVAYLTLKDFARAQNGSSSVTGTSSLDPRELATTARRRGRGAAKGKSSPAGALRAVRAALRSSTGLAGTDAATSSGAPESSGRLVVGLAGLGALALGAWWLTK